MDHTCHPLRAVISVLLMMVALILAAIERYAGKTIQVTKLPRNWRFVLLVFSHRGP
jgi:hypothetical protein